MKRVLFPVLALLLYLAACGGQQAQSVSLKEIAFDGVSIGDDFSQVETSKYTPSGRYAEEDENTYCYEEWRVTVTDGTITEIRADFLSDISISVNGETELHTIENVTDLLGPGYSSSWYDREQSLMQAQYTDAENGLQCSFVYDKRSNGLVWVILSRAA